MSHVDIVREELAGEFRATVRERVASVANRWAALEKRGNWQEVSALLGELHTLKGESRLMGYVSCATLVHGAEELLSRSSKSNAKPQQHVGDLLFAILSAVERRTAGLATSDLENNESAALLAKVYSNEASAEVVAAAAIETQAPASIATVAQSERDVARDLTAGAANAFSESARELVATHVRYDVTMRELGRTLQSAIDGHNPQVLSRALELYRDLQEEVQRGRNQADRLNERALALRLYPVQRLFDRFTRPVRELARSLDKDVVLETSGGEVMLDRQIVERLFDPLMHLMRNAVDHGIENTSSRIANGKTARAFIRLSVQHLGSRALLRLTDDGGGFDLDAIRRRAVSTGLLSSSEADTASSERLITTTFTPGFTTRDRATETSGRGIGLDVVKRAIDQVGGILRVSSTRGAGTTFELDVPSTLSLTQVLLVQVSGRLFALPTSGLQSVTQNSEVTRTHVHGRNAIVLHGTVVPFASLSDILSLNDSPCDHTVVLSTDAARMALGVDGWSDVLQCVVAPLPRTLSAQRLLLGATVIGGGAVALVLNPTELVQRGLGVDGTTRRVIRPAAEPVRKVRRVLLVEDSVITRTMLARLLAGIDYSVREAVDGQHALELLASESFDIVLTDLDMPKLDGFGLIEEIRRSELHRHLPIVVLTTRGADVDKERATRAGANAYLVKTSFSEPELRAALERQHE